MGDPGSHDHKSNFLTVRPSLTLTFYYSLLTQQILVLQMLWSSLHQTLLSCQMKKHTVSVQALMLDFSRHFGRIRPDFVVSRLLDLKVLSLIIILFK